MAQLPDVTSFGERPTPISRRPIVSDRSGEIVGNAIEGAANELGRIGERLAARQDKFNYAKAKSALLMADIEARKELENDRDWETHEARYRDRIAKARETAGGMIRSQSDKALFEMDAEFDLERGASAVRDRARNIEVDIARADLDEMGAAARTSGLEASDEQTRAAIIQNYRDALAGAVDSGYLSAEEATKRRQAWAVDFTEGYLKTLPADQRIALLSKPETNETRFLDKDRRTVLLDQARNEDKETRIRGASQSASDRIMDKFSDRGEALAEARKISDPEIRDAVTNRVNARFAEIQAIDNERNDKAFTEASTLVEQSGSVNEIDISTWQTVLTQPQRQALEQRAKQLRDGIPSSTDQALWYELRLQAVDEPSKFVKRNLMEVRPSLSDSDFQSMADLQARMRADDGSADKLLSGIRTRQQVVDGALREIGLDYGDSASPEENTRANNFRDMVDKRVVDEQRLTGKETTPEDVQRITDELIMEVNIPRAWWPDKTVRTFEIAPEDMAVIPSEIRPRMEAAMIRKGIPITDVALLNLYNAYLDSR